MTDKAGVLERLATRPGLTDRERAVLKEAAAHFRALEPAAAPTRRAEAPSDPAAASRQETKSAPQRASDAREDSPTRRDRLRSPEAAVSEADAILWSDGAARGNPGPAGAGAILRTPKGVVLAELCGFLGHTTNNVAEYRALLMGLEQALALGVRRLEVRADSELLIKQLRGEYRVKDPKLKPLWQEAKQLLARFDAARLQHVRREQNSDADRLANAGIDGR
jgi:ribonuclease HI